MNNPADVESRNALGPAYVAADNLYNHALTLARMCDTWSKSDRGPHITPVAATLLRHNLSQAQDNLAALRQALAESLDTAPVTAPVDPFLTAENDPGDDRVAITPAEAISMLPDGDSIHTFRQAAFGGPLIGADWDRTDIENALEKYSAELTGEISTNRGYGLAFADPTGYVFVQTKQRTPINKETQ